MNSDLDRLEKILAKSRATKSFKEAVNNFANGVGSDLIRCSPRVPPIKILRVILKLLEEFPDEEISNVVIEGRSTCSSFYGNLTFAPNNTTIQFDWDCHWRAEQEGFKTWYGAADQTKAAQLFGYQCFRVFNKLL